jgi:hypothetical protein
LGDLGHFCQFSPTPTASVNKTAVFACANVVRPPLAATGGEYGALRFEFSSGRVSCRALNFTKCVAARASAIEFTSVSTAANRSSFSFFSIVDCEGANSIALPSSSGVGGYPFFGFSLGNLYGNNCSSGVFGLSSASVTVEHCVFFGNTKDFAGSASTNSTLIGCVFSLALPDVANLSLSLNAASTSTESIAVDLSLLYRCPLSICRTWSFSISNHFQESAGIGARATFHLLSDRIHPSLSLGLTRVFKLSIFPSQSEVFSSSNLLTISNANPFPASAGIGARPTFHFLPDRIPTSRRTRRTGGLMAVATVAFAFAVAGSGAGYRR